MKRICSIIAAVLFMTACAFTACAALGDSETLITLSDNGIKVNGSTASTNNSAAVYTGASIVYYEAGHDESYGEGTSADEHSAEEANEHTVVTITQPGKYRINGTLSKGQIAVDLGKDASTNPSAVVTLILDNTSITCTVAPAIIFYNVYECGSKDTENASQIVDTSNAGANIIIADDSTNNINGSYVARIYKEGTTSKLHKYDAALYSKMSINATGEEKGTGILNIAAENEGFDSEMHLTINGGNINITAENDGINTNEDGISVTTINGGRLYINGGFGVEGDGIDSNGYLVINGGTVITSASAESPDGGIDADKGIFLNGGTVIAIGRQNDMVNSNSEQVYMELSFNSTQKADELIRIESSEGEEIITLKPSRDYQSLTVSTPTLSIGITYHVYTGGEISKVEGTNGLYEIGGAYTKGIQQQYTGTGGSGRFGGMMRGNINQDGTMPEAGTEGQRDRQPPENMENFDPSQRPEGMENFERQRPEGMENFDPSQRPEGMEDFEPGQRPEGMENFESWQRQNGVNGNQNQNNVPGSVEFTLTAESKSFSGVSEIISASGGNVFFSDIDENSPYYEAIQFVYKEGLMAGTGNNLFSPLTPVSRAMTITVLGNLAKAETVEGNSFNDVIAGSWYAPYVGWAEKSNIITGYGNGLFGTNDSVTREQICVILYNYAKYAGIKLESSGLNFSDTAMISSWANEAVEACAASGLIDGLAENNGALNPQQTLTRAELADILTRLAQINI